MFNPGLWRVRRFSDVIPEMLHLQMEMNRLFFNVGQKSPQDYPAVNIWENGRIKEATMMYSEYEIGDYERLFTLSDEIDRDKVLATVKNGMLRLELPKAEKVKPKKSPFRWRRKKGSMVHEIRDTNDEIRFARSFPAWRKKTLK